MMLGVIILALAGPGTALAASNTWTAESSMATAREQHTATLLGNGKVLVTGGQNLGTVLSSAELYTPSTNTWSSAASMSVARSGHTATLLSSGKVLVVGAGSAELYDPTANTWTGTGALAENPGGRFTATLLGTGKVLIAGGDGGLGTAAAELYDPTANTWSPTGSMNRVRSAHVAALLSSGKVLVAGGYTYNFLGRENTSELYDPTAGSWSLVPGVTYGPTFAVMTRLPGGQVLMAGGQSCATVASVTVPPTAGVCGASLSVPLAQIYDPTLNSWLPAASMGVARARFAASLLPDGRVLVEGGQTLGSVTGPAVTASAELYTPVAGGLGTWSAAGSMSTSRTRQSATLVSGNVLVVGGSDVTGTDQSSVESYAP